MWEPGRLSRKAQSPVLTTMCALSLVSPGWADGLSNEDASLLVPRFPTAIMGAVGGGPGERMLLGVCTVWVLGVMLLGDWVLYLEKML